MIRGSLKATSASARSTDRRIYAKSPGPAASPRLEPNDMDVIDTVVVGAGVIGLACADALARAGREAVVVETDSRYGSGISSRNSEVIHSGIYYPPGSEKARLCVTGRQKLYEFCAEHGVPHRRCGKLIVATRDAQRAELERLQARGLANGVEGLRLLERGEVQRLEPRLNCVAALLSESTGIVDSHALMTALLGRAQRHGANLALRTRFAFRHHDGRRGIRGSPRRCRWHVALSRPAVGHRRRPHRAVGGGAHRGHPEGAAANRALRQGQLLRVVGPRAVLAADLPGTREGRTGRASDAGPGGTARFGPDVEWIGAPDYSVSTERLQTSIVQSVRTGADWPTARLRPDYAGVRPKIYAPDQPAADFDIAGPVAHGIDGLVCLFGIESPGLTAALAIGEVVARQLE